MENGNIVVTFEHSILTVKFLENANIELEDVKEIYAYGNKWAHGKPYCILFDALHHYEVSEDAIEFISNDNIEDGNILAKAYVISTKEAEMKTRAHLRFDHPKLVPRTFYMIEDARKYLESVVAEYEAKHK